MITTTGMSEPASPSTPCTWTAPSCTRWAAIGSARPTSTASRSPTVCLYAAPRAAWRTVRTMVRRARAARSSSARSRARARPAASRRHNKCTTRCTRSASARTVLEHAHASCGGARGRAGPAMSPKHARNMALMMAKLDEANPSCTLPQVAKHTCLQKAGRSFCHAQLILARVQFVAPLTAQRASSRAPARSVFPMRSPEVALMAQGNGGRCFGGAGAA
mmetsp:Transcript_10996/g.34701  ORF Transcript_10996/g.34701 Transcript_10996/m.34701 type:complete len:219 (-) Transcript_10996:464-1120(-)